MMSRMFDASIEVVLAATILLPILFIWKKLLSENRKEYIYLSVFALYLSGVYAVVGLPTIQNYTFSLSIEIIPFTPMLRDLEQSILNVILLLPLGILLPIAWREFMSVGRIALFGFGFSLAIETLQILTHRATDVNDLILNTTGAVIGYFIVCGIAERQEIIGRNRDIKHLYMLIGIVFGVMFLIQPIISNLFWRMVFIL